MQPMATLIFDIDGTNKVTVKDVKEMLLSAAKALSPLQQHLEEAKALVQQFKNKGEKESKALGHATPLVPFSTD